MIKLTALSCLTFLLTCSVFRVVAKEDSLLVIESKELLNKNPEFRKRLHLALNNATELPYGSANPWRVYKKNKPHDGIAQYFYLSDGPTHKDKMLIAVLPADSRD